MTKDIKQIQEFFYKKQHISCASHWYHGYFYDKYTTNEYITVFLPLAPILRLLRIIYLHFKFGSVDLRRYYKNQQTIRNDRLTEKNRRA